MAQIQPVIRNTIKSGLITRSAVSELEYPKDACLESVNLYFDNIGKAKMRNGIIILENQLDVSNILEIYQLNNGYNNPLMAVNNTTVYYVDNGLWPID